MRLCSDEGGIRREYPLRQGSQVIGRHPTCHIVIPGRNVSKKHLQCLVENDVVTIRDLGSSNGTLVNGSPVSSCVLKDADQISLGGYLLAFDLHGEAPGPALEPQAGQPAFDYSPAGAAVPPGPPPSPDAVLSFQKEPDNDATPADGSFVPQAYAPAALQPQVVARDGHMYLRDPRTNREVEIIPRKPTGAQTDLAGYYAERDVAERKKNYWLIGGAIGVALLMIIALAVTSLSKEETPKPVHKLTTTQYNAAAEQSIEQMTQGKFKEAIDQLMAAHNEYPSYAVASALREIAEQWQKSGKPQNEFNWLSVEPSLRELRENRWATAKVKTFAANRIDWVYDVQNQRVIAQEAVRLRDAGEPEKALAEFAKLPADSIVRRESEPQIAACVLAAFNLYVQKAKDAMDKGNWNDAITEYKAAEKFATAPQKQDIAREVRTARKYLDQEAILNNANALLREDSPRSLKDALRVLDGVDNTGPFGPKKAALRQRIESRIEEQRNEERAAVALGCYKAGRGTEAIQVITEDHITALYPIRARIDKLTNLFKEAQAAFLAKDYDLAKSKWTEITTEEPDTENTYHRNARARLDELHRNAKDIALDYNHRGDEAVLHDDPKTARKMYMYAIAWDPLATIGAEGIRDLLRIAELTYNKARDLQYGGGPKEKEEALKLFEKVLRYAEEGSDFYKRARQHISELRAGG